MDIGEAVKQGLIAAEESDPTCNEKDSPTDWKSRVNKYNSQETCSGSRLYDNMEKEREPHKSKGLGVVPKKVPGKSWELDLLSESEFPIQAHHLIPKNFLPKHKVTVFLAVKYKDHPKYELLDNPKSDSCYDTDNANNGYCLPYASPMKEWGSKKISKVVVAFDVMYRTGLQLHQGSHPFTFDSKKINKKAGAPILPPINEADGGSDSDEDEIDEIETPGYLSAVRRLLDVVNAKTLAHIERPCNCCRKGKKGNKIQIQPLKSVADMMDQVSYIIKVLIDAQAIYVSWYSYGYAFFEGYIMQKGKEWHLSDAQVEKLRTGLTR